MTSRPAVFIDRDGTLTEAIRRLNAAGVAAVVVTNRAGIARSYFSEEVLHAVNDTLTAELRRASPAARWAPPPCSCSPATGEASGSTAGRAFRSSRITSPPICWRPSTGRWPGGPPK